MPEPIISVSGLRGIVGESLTPEVAARFRRVLRGHAKSRGYRLRNGSSVTAFLPHAAAERALLFCQAQRRTASDSDVGLAESN